MSHYETLQVSHDAGDQVIRAAYKALAQQWHPDKHPDKQAAELRFKEIAEAYRVLSDPALRRLYDEGLSRHKEESNPSRASPSQGGKSTQSKSTGYEEALRAVYAEAIRVFKAKLTWGIVWLSLGGGITLFGYLGASQHGGGKYLIFYGLILLGLFKIASALYLYWEIKRKFGAFAAQDKSEKQGTSKRGEGNFTKSKKEGAAQREDRGFTDNNKTEGPADSLVAPVVIALAFIVVIASGFKVIQRFASGNSLESGGVIPESKSSLPAQNAANPKSEVQKKYFSEYQRIISSQGDGIELSILILMSMISTADDSINLVENLQELPSIKWVAPNEKCMRDWICLSAETRVALYGFELQEVLQDDRIGGPAIWRLHIISRNSAELNPEYFLLQPDCKSQNCEFNFDSYLKDSPFKHKVICELSTTFLRKVYEVHNDNKYLYVVSDSAGGSGGWYSALRFQFTKPSFEACDESSLFSRGQSIEAELFWPQY